MHGDAMDADVTRQSGRPCWHGSALGLRDGAWLTIERIRAYSIILLSSMRWIWCRISLRGEWPSRSASNTHSPKIFRTCLYGRAYWRLTACHTASMTPASINDAQVADVRGRRQISCLVLPAALPCFRAFFAICPIFLPPPWSWQFSTVVPFLVTHAEYHAAPLGLHCSPLARFLRPLSTSCIARMGF